ncbi:MAG: putative calcium/calmodulin-dependent protein kinase type 1, partial [Streblomastix strix]
NLIQSLENVIVSKKDLSIPLIRAIIRQILEGLRLMHEQGIIHRDIKGQNILMHSPPGSGRVVLKLADLGLVKMQKQIQSSSVMTVAGTLPYIAPEALFLKEQSENVISDGKVDVWSAGIVIYLLAIHTFPFKSIQQSDIIEFMRRKTLIRPPSMKNDYLWDLLTKMLAFDRKDRLSAEQALNHPFLQGRQATDAITEEIKDLALKAQQARQIGDQNITDYDINALFIIPQSDIQRIIQFDPEVENIERKERLGKGTFGIVRHSIEINSQLHMILKEIDYEEEKEKEMVDKDVEMMRLAYENVRQSTNSAQILRIVQPLGFFVDEDEGKAYIVLEYCSGGDLRKYINNMKEYGMEISTKKAYEIFGMIADSLNQLHAIGILH